MFPRGTERQDENVKGEREKENAREISNLSRDLSPEVLNFLSVSWQLNQLIHASYAPYIRRIARNCCEAKRRITVDPIFGEEEDERYSVSHTHVVWILMVGVNVSRFKVPARRFAAQRLK